MSQPSTTPSILEHIQAGLSTVSGFFTAASKEFMEHHNAQKNAVVDYIVEAIEKGGIKEPEELKAIMETLDVPQRLNLNNNVLNAREAAGIPVGQSLENWIKETLSRDLGTERDNVIEFAKFVKDRLLGNGTYVHPTDVVNLEVYISSKEEAKKVLDNEASVSTVLGTQALKPV